MSSVWMISASACVVAWSTTSPRTARTWCAEIGGLFGRGVQLCPWLRRRSLHRVRAVHEFLITDACDDGLDVEFRLFSLDTTQTWPNSSTLLTAGLDATRSADPLRGGARVFGARAGDLVWGAGLDGQGGLQRPFLYLQLKQVDMSYLTCG